MSQLYDIVLKFEKSQKYFLLYCYFNGENPPSEALVYSYHRKIASAHSLLYMHVGRADRLAFLTPHVIAQPRIVGRILYLLHIRRGVIPPAVLSRRTTLARIGGLLAVRIRHDIAAGISRHAISIGAYHRGTAVLLYSTV